MSELTAFWYYFSISTRHPRVRDIESPRYKHCVDESIFSQTGGVVLIIDAHHRRSQDFCCGVHFILA